MFTVLTWMRATRNLAKKLMRALFQATLLASVRSKRRMWAIVFCPFKIHLAMILLRITARWPFMHFQRSIFVLYLERDYKSFQRADRRAAGGDTSSHHGKRDSASVINVPMLRLGSGNF